MNVKDMYDYLKSLSKSDVNTTDTLKIGSWEKEIKKVAVCCIATIEVIQKAAEWGAGAVFFEGNIDFYGKSGFTFASEFGIRYHGLPEGEDASFFLGKELKKGCLDGISGEYATPQGYFVPDEEVEKFDQEFPAKVKRKLPGQIF